MAVYFVAGEIPPKMVMEGTLFGKATLRVQTPEEVSLDKLLKGLSKLGDEDEWWFWKRMGGRRSLDGLQVGLKEEEMERHLDSFKQVFDNEWWSSICKQSKKIVTSDPLAAFGGQIPTIRILRLGEAIYNIAKEGEIPLELVKRLRNKNSFWSAATELDVASCFVQAGFDLEMYPPTNSGSKPEGKVVIEGDTVYYEVTEQHTSGYQAESSLAEKNIIEWLSRSCGPLGGSISFKSGRDQAISRAEEFLEILREYYNPELKSLDPLPLKFENGDFDVYLEKADPTGGWVSIEGLEPTFSTIVSNWVNRILEKYKQLPPKQSGVIIGSPLFLWGPDEVGTAHAKIGRAFSGGHYTRVSGIILCAKHIENSGFIKHVPQVLINQNATIDNTEMILKMARALFDFPDWL